MLAKLLTVALLGNILVPFIQNKWICKLDLQSVIIILLSWSQFATFRSWIKQWLLFHTSLWLQSFGKDLLVLALPVKFICILDPELAICYLLKDTSKWVFSCQLFFNSSMALTDFIAPIKSFVDFCISLILVLGVAMM